jgi:hypothetical protein
MTFLTLCLVFERESEHSDENKINIIMHNTCIFPENLVDSEVILKNVPVRICPSACSATRDRRLLRTRVW